MRSIKTALKISGSLIFLSFVISILILYYLKLDKPVFLKSYKDVEVFENEGNFLTQGYDVEIKYISNREDKRKVSSIIFKDAPELNFYASETSSMGIVEFYNYHNDNIESYGRYGIHTVFLNLNSQSYGYDLSKDIVLSEATVIFDDGLTMDVDLGKVVLFKNKFVETLLANPSTSSSSDGYRQSVFWAKEYIQISKIYSRLFEDTKDLFDFNVNKNGNLDDRDLIYNKNEYVFFISQFHYIDDPIKKLYTFDIKPNIYFNDRNGNEYEKRVYDIIYYPKFNFYNIYRYLREVGEI